MFRKIVFFGLFFIFLISFNLPVLAKSTIEGHFFYGKGCPHCAKEKVLLEKLGEKYDFFQIKEYEIYYNSENAQLLQKVAGRLQIDTSGVPIFIVGEKAIIGYLSDETTGKSIENLILDYYKSENCPDIVGSLEYEDKGETRILLPLIGEIDAKSLSLPLLTIVLGALDGFNPCAMWILLFLISLLLGMKERSRMWILGSTFILASALVYFLFMAAWLNLFLFLNLIGWVRFLIGLVALASGGYFLRDFWVNREGGCVVVPQEKRKKWFQRIRGTIQQPSFVLAILGMIVLAFGVNLIELICSAGLPAVYTKVLTLSNLSIPQYYGYLLLYILIFLLDDLLVFVIAMLTLQAVGFQGKYARYSHLIGGILMLAIGALMLFKPEWLMFG